jgi:tRNA uridine 5-carbamoylmethylation protein Kti12
MASLNTKIKKYLEANSKVYFDEFQNYVLQNDGSGDYIKSWNVSGLVEPTAEQLETYNSSATTEENNNIIRATRKDAYGNISDQLDEIYKDIDAWKARIQSIKDANPKETE